MTMTRAFYNMTQLDRQAINDFISTVNNQISIQANTTQEVKCAHNVGILLFNYITIAITVIKVFGEFIGGLFVIDNLQRN